MPLNKFGNFIASKAKRFASGKGLGLTSTIVNAEFNAFYNLPSSLGGKSVQPAWRFYAAHVFNPFQGMTSFKDIAKKFLEGPPPLMRAYHVKNVSVPTYQMKKEAVQYGAVPRTFPVLDVASGLNLQMTYEEDDKGTIAFLINWLQRKIIDSEGYYNAPLKNRIMIIIEAHDQSGRPNAVYIFHDCYYHLSQTPQYSYDSQSPMSYTVTYGFDRMSVSFPKYSLIGTALDVAGGMNILKKQIKSDRKDR